MSTTAGSRPKPQRLEHSGSSNDGQATPTSLHSALSALRSAGARKAQSPGEADDYNYHYQRERELEIEAEKAKQQRIRDKGLGFRMKGNVRRGEIDGMSITHISSNNQDPAII